MSLLIPEMGLTWEYDEKNNAYCLKNVPYCANVTHPELQAINISVPAAYLNSDGTVNREGKCGKYTAATAPIIFENSVGGYAEARPAPLGAHMQQGEECLAHGFVYVNAGARGRQTEMPDGTYCGKAPAVLADLKAGIRFLRHNRDNLPGDMDKIISCGISAGGAMSSMVGITGNCPDYVPYLIENGAVLDEKDDVYAAQCYCPIIDLEDADLAYEWMFQGSDKWQGMGRMVESGEMSPFLKELSALMAEAYTTYFNSLKLRDPETGDALTLNKEGQSGSAYDYLMKVVEGSAAKYLKLLDEGKGEHKCSSADYISGNYTYEKHMPPKGGTITVQGIDKRSFLTWDGEKASVTSLADMEKEFVPRLKACPSFDDFDLRQAENEEFGNETTSKRHFDPYLAALIAQLKDKYPEEYAKHYQGYADIIGDKELDRQKYLLNPVNFIGTKVTHDQAPHFRVRVGTADPHTSFTMAMLLATKLQNSGKSEVDYDMVWDFGHGRADFPGEFAAWVESLV